MEKYCSYFGLTSKPFVSSLSTKDLMSLPGTLAVGERMNYCIELGGLMVVTGDVGAGKSTSLRWALSQHHPSQVLSLYVVAGSGSPCELYKQLCWALGLNISSSSRVALLKAFKATLEELVTRRKQKVILTIDEASLLRSDVFAELHTLTQFHHDSKNLLTMVLAGQSSLIDKLTYRSSQPLASRVIARTHLSSLNLEQMKSYLLHHLQVAGCKTSLFEDSAITAVHQGSSGLLRRANTLARGGLIAAMNDNQNHVSADHIRLASTEII